MYYLKNILIASLFIMAQFSFSQVSKWSVEANYPVPLGDGFFGKYYSGVVDVGVKYRMLSFSGLEVGASINGGYFNKNVVNYIPSYPGDFPDQYEGARITNFTILPRIFAELNSEKMGGFHPFAGAGYGILLFNVADGGVQPFDAKSMYGVNVNLGVYYLINKSLFAQLQYDYIGLNEVEIPTSYSAKNVSILKIGMGVML